MEQCSICLEDIKFLSTKIELSCGHSFHEKCISKWYKLNEKKTCPYCRNSIKEPYMFNMIKNRENEYYKFKHKKKTIKINDYNIDYYNMLLNKNAIPFSWVEQNITIFNTLKNREADIILPTYILNIKRQEELIISFYARLYILFSKKKKIELQKKKCINGYIFFDTDEEINSIFSKKEFHICFEWIYDVLTELKYKYDLNYLSITNTLLFDIFFKTIEKLTIERSQIQAVLVCSIYNSIHILEKKKNLPSLDEINFYTNKTYTLEQINPFFETQNNILKDSLTKI